MANDVVPAGSDTPTDAEQALPPPPQRRPSSDAQSSSPKATTATTKPPSPSSSSTAHPRNPLLEEDDDDDPFSKDVEGGVAHSVHHHDDDDDELIRSQQQQRDEHYEQASQGVVMPYYYLLRDSPAYRLMWFASIVSMLGDWLNFLATVGRPSCHRSITGAIARAETDTFAMLCSSPHSNRSRALPTYSACSSSRECCRTLCSLLSSALSLIGALAASGCYRHGSRPHSLTRCNCNCVCWMA